MKSLNESEKQKTLLIQQLKFQYEEMDNDKKCSQQHLLRYVLTSTRTFFTIKSKANQTT